MGFRPGQRSRVSEPVVTQNHSPLLAMESHGQGTCYGFQVQSSFSFRYLRRGDGNVLRIVPSQQAELGSHDHLLRKWTPRASHQREACLYHNGSTFRLRVGHAEWYEVDPAACVISAPDPDDSLRREQHLWGIPAALCFLERGDLALHAAAVEVNRSAVLLAAPGGFGKSTLAAAFVRAGHRLLSEDLSCVRPTATPSVVPGPAMLRLRRDVVQGLRLAPGEPVRESADRITYALPSGPRGDCTPVLLRGIVFLHASPAAVRLERMPTAQAMSHLWILNLQIPTQTHKARLFAGVAQLASQVPVWNLYRPMRIEELPAIVERISLVCLGGEASSRESPSL